MGIGGGTGLSSSASAKKAADNKALDLASLRHSQNISSQQSQVNLTQSLLDRAREDDELRRRLLGGGGGGGSRKFQPYVPFSFLKIAQSLEALRANFLDFLRTAPQNLATINIPNLLRSLPGFNQAKNLLLNLANSTANLFANFSKPLTNALANARAMATNFVTTGFALTSSLVGKMLKLLRLKDEEEIIEEKEENRIVDFFDGIKTFFTKRGGEQDDNKRNIFSHFENIADQITGFLKTI